MKNKENDKGLEHHIRAGRRAAGFTLLELFISIGIIGILATLTIVGWPKILAYAANARCLGNMRSLHVSLGSYVQDVGHWPQVPEDIDGPAEEDWWLNELKPYGGTPQVWQCPLIQREVASKSPDGRPKIHYTPTGFDAKPGTPYRWNQPWLTEIGNAHGHGANMCFTDGSIRTVDDVVGRP